MNFRTWLSASYRMLRSSNKPGREEFFLLLRICLLGIAVVGALGFLVQYLSSLLGMLGG